LPATDFGIHALSAFGGNAIGTCLQFSSLVVSDEKSSFPDKLVFTYRDDELSSYDRAVAARRHIGVDYSDFLAARIVVTLGVGLIVVLANRVGLIPLSVVPPVLVTAYAAFVAGAFAYRLLMKLTYRRMARALRKARAAVDETSEMIFAPDGVVYRTPTLETRLPWRAIVAIGETDVLVLIWIDLARGFPIPARMFADRAEREAFVAALRTRALAAKAITQP
jgi:hypothetical protein